MMGRAFVLALEIDPLFIMAGETAGAQHALVMKAGDFVPRRAAARLLRGCDQRRWILAGKGGSTKEQEGSKQCSSGTGRHLRFAGAPAGRRKGGANHFKWHRLLLLSCACWSVVKAM